MTVSLLPGDIVSTGGLAKPLGDCTLADLRRYAAELEADVWETFQQITLPELDADEQVEVRVMLPDEALQSIEDWPTQVLVMQPADIGTTDVEVGPEEAPSEPQRNDAQTAKNEDSEPRSEDGHEDDQVAEGELPGVAVAEAELVFPEIEVEVGGVYDDEVLAAGQDGVIPSQARVRVAGGRLPLGDPTWAAVDILMDEPALRAAQAHALSSLNREVAGVLIGRRPEKQPDGRYLVHIFDTIVAKHTVMQGASVTYTPESWRYLNDTLNERYPDDTAVMVGWYHTHPGFGIFLSGMDLFIHQNFFTQIWHVAMVLDPQARTSGFFCWDRPQSRVGRHEFAWPEWAAESW